ncbi:TRAP transporter substrate-binding protein [Leisingera methylohalidivorans]|uniref:C4-dicarboxylate ABC transporter substrate-binding protein n=1 Tax=Leisingera methylohalidivorans DSM 14336 TaxID=999552 RepID=V9W2V3_9RHOB|nr:TRAP transporter substrate-binding protein [Leisingera methylohalidivorans]AHD03512.1 C4-dicarboxylate ABC transporter substrate-binding protein [Leisingera methylohalidivorans DSM 14336]
MSFLKKVCTLTAAVSAAAMLTTGAVSAKNFKIAVGDGAGSSQEGTGKFFIEALEKKSGGEHTGTMFLNGQLGSEQDTVNEAAIGTLDMSLLAINNVTPFSPTVGVFTLPYVILSLEDAEKLTQGPIGQELTENTIRDAGVRILAWTYTGFRRLTNSQKPVTTVADLQGLVIRVPKNEIMIETYKSWGINPTPMAWSETFTGLQTQVVDGQDNPYTTINAMKFYEVQKYVTNLRYIFSIEPLIVSEAVFQDLSEEDQQILIEAGKEATVKSAQYLRDIEAEIKESLLAKGMQIDDPANDEAEFIKLATEAVWPQFYDSIGGVDKLNTVLTTIGRDPVQ